MVGDLKMEIYKRMADVMKNISHIAKKSENRQQGFKFRGIDDVYNGVHEAMTMSEIFCTPRVIQAIKDKEIVSAKGAIGHHVILEIEFTFHAPDGSWVKAVTWGEASDYGDKVINKCMSIAHKYALVQCFVIPTASDDPDELSPQVNAKADNGVNMILMAFSKYNVTVQQLQEYIRKPLNLITEQDKTILRTLLERLKNGEQFAPITENKTARSLVNDLIS